jgi:riboflavin kinase/FMN adenylyltransferase
MRILRHFEDVPAELKGAVVAVGNFDGVHRGHQALIAAARARAQARAVPLAVLTFEPHPQEYFRPSPESFRLTPLRTKARLLAGLGVDVLFALTFDGEMARRPAPEFVRRVLAAGLGVGGVVVGRDFEFGKGRAGNLATLVQMGEAAGFTVTAFDTVSSGGADKISSTDIRAALKAARPEAAARLLGHYWAAEARVEHGDARGRTFGFPTANMHLHHCLAPAFGVYAARVDILDNEKVAERHDGVANFGVRPMYRTPTPLLETHLFDFDGDLYGKYLSVELIGWLRPEASFAGRDALIAQIRQDAARARALLAATPESPMLDA